MGRVTDEWDEFNKKIQRKIHETNYESCRDALKDEEDLTPEERRKLMAGCMVERNHMPLEEELKLIREGLALGTPPAQIHVHVSKTILRSLRNLPPVEPISPPPATPLTPEMQKFEDWIREAIPEAAELSCPQKAAVLAQREAPDAQTAADFTKYLVKKYCPVGSQEPQELSGAPPTDVCTEGRKYAPDAETADQFEQWCRTLNPELGEAPPEDPATIPKVLKYESSDLPVESDVFSGEMTKVRMETGRGRAASGSGPPPPPTHTITLTRTFGLQPCEGASTVPPEVFSRFEKVVNRLIRAGVALPDDAFEGKGMIAVKRFYDRVRGTPAMEALWQWRDTQPLQLKERMWRCAAQPAYFALRDYKIRCRLLHYFINTLQARRDTALMFDAKFPQKEVFNTIYANLPQLDLQLTKGQVSRVYLGNVLRWMRNLVRQGIKTKYRERVINTFILQLLPPHLTYELARWLASDLPDFLDAYLRSLSRQLTGRVKRTLRSAKRTLPKTKQGALIRRILKAQNLNMRTLDAEGWERARKNWRDMTYEYLRGKCREIDVTALATHAVNEGQAGLTQDRVLNILFNFRPRRLQLGAGDLAEFKAFLVHRAITELEYRRITLLKPHLAPLVQQFLGDLLAEPRAWLQLPRFQKQTIPFGLDDARVYHDEAFKELFILALHKQGKSINETIQFLMRKFKSKKESEAYQKKIVQTREYIEKLIEFDNENDWFEQVKKRKAPIRLQLRLEVGNPMWFKLRTPKRFLKFLQAGYTPQKGTLLKKRGGGLVLAIPFEKDVPTSQCLGRSDLPQIQDPLIIAGVDPGLKTWATLSIGKGDTPGAGTWGQAGQEIARYFYDQKQFGYFYDQKQKQFSERRTEWFKPLKNKASPPDYKKGKFPNLKRRLTNLRRELRLRQSERDEYRNRCRDRGINPRRKRQFWHLNSAVKRMWDNLSALHDELTRQIATCILAACEYHQVRIIRMEDLRWSRHSKKYNVSYYLAANQIHWFFGQVQARIADLAPRKGIFVEWVSARQTSSRCSNCGYIGKTKAERKKARKGKIFKCPKCGQKRNGKWSPFQLDADLNAARNIRVAPVSTIPPSLYALVGGSPYNPLGDESLTI